VTWHVWSVIVLMWPAGWLVLGSRYTARKQGDELVEAYGGVLMAFAIATSLIACVSAGRHSVVSVLALWIHHVATWSLFAFLLAGEAFQWEAWWRIRDKATVTEVAATYRRLWILTTIVPAPIAITIFLTGLRLIWQSPERNSPGDI
jgi:hypothetical protein